MFYAVLDKNDCCVSVGIGEPVRKNAVEIDENDDVLGRYYYDGDWHIESRVSQLDKIEADTAYLVMVSE